MVDRRSWVRRQGRGLEALQRIFINTEFVSVISKRYIVSDKAIAGGYKNYSNQHDRRYK